MEMVLEGNSRTNWNWLQSGQEAFPAMLNSIDTAQFSVRLESYIVSQCELAVEFLDALVEARVRGVRVKVLIDALGSCTLPHSFWDDLRSAGGEVREFNPLSLNALGIRNHRKLLVCDERVAFVGGFNISPEYEGDGVTRGWFDLGLKLGGPIAPQLARSFDEMFERAPFKHKRFVRLRKSAAKKALLAPQEQLLLSGPGRGRSPFKRALMADLGRAGEVRIMVAYFLPTWALRRQLARVVKRGGHVQLLLAGRSDVALSQLAGQSLYRRLLRAGIGIFEYRPQVLHAKLIVIDDIVYAGSANLDQRSLNINYELMVRFENQEMAALARDIFERALQHTSAITSSGWRAGRSVWRRLKQRWAYFLLVRMDPYIARRQWRGLPD